MKGLLPGGLMAAMLPGVVSAGETEADCIKAAAKPLSMTTDEVAAQFDYVYVGSKGDDTSVSDYTPDPGDLDFNDDDNDLICGFDGDDYIFEIGSGDVFLGGKGNDGVGVNIGKVLGGDGNDYVNDQYGFFDGGKNKADGDTVFAYCDNTVNVENFVLPPC